MQNTNNKKRLIPTNHTKSGKRIVTDIVRETSQTLQKRSFEKYNHKAKLIDEANDMNTQEKIEMLDQSYHSHCKEVIKDQVIWGTIRYFIKEFIN